MFLVAANSIQAPRASTALDAKPFMSGFAVVAARATPVANERKHVWDRKRSSQQAAESGSRYQNTRYLPKNKIAVPDMETI